MHYGQAYVFSDSPARVRSVDDYRDLDPAVTLEQVLRAGRFLVNFLMTREAFERAGGYPEHHGFDTQGFTMRFLRRCQRVEICPGTYYYHRRFSRGESYYEREFRSGRYAVNLLLVAEEVIDMLADDALEALLRAPLVPDEGGFQSPLHLVSRANPLFAPSGHKRPDHLSAFLSGIEAYRTRRSSDSVRLFTDASAAAGLTPVLSYFLLRSAASMGADPDTNGHYDHFTMQLLERLHISEVGPLRAKKSVARRLWFRLSRWIK